MTSSVAGETRSLQCSLFPACASQALVSRWSASSASDVPPFALLGNGSQEILDAVERKLGDEAAVVEDVYPCTSMQETMITLTAKHPELYISTRSWTLDQEVDLQRFCDAWERAFLANPILRTRIVQLPQGLFQVVLKEEINWEAGTESSLFLGPVIIAQGPLIRFAIARRMFAVQLHHALFDAWSLNLICEQVERAYHGQALVSRPFAPWMKHLLAQDRLARVIAYEQMGLERIRMAGSDASAACGYKYVSGLDVFEISREMTSLSPTGDELS